ncbi:hypothetical protein ACIQZB_22665 [Streptomyces sp. NPDC097727]|uniref:hypothetical protein n=1 Tax=Streptomyces sp. NPDC097727 TaxID=3366092 RepID=UPI003807BB4B
MLDLLSADYVPTARAKGLSGRAVVGGHALRNVLVIVVTALGLQLGHLTNRRRRSTSPSRHPYSICPATSSATAASAVCSTPTTWPPSSSSPTGSP